MLSFYTVRIFRGLQEYINNWFCFILINFRNFTFPIHRYNIYVHMWSNNTITGARKRFYFLRTQVEGEKTTDEDGPIRYGNTLIYQLLLDVKSLIFPQ